MKSPRNIALVLVLTCLSLTACGSKSQDVSDYSVTTDLSGLVQDETALPTRLYTRPGAPELAVYDSFIVDPVEFNYQDANMQTLSLEKVARMQTYLRNQVMKELIIAGYDIVTQPRPNTMRISFTVSGLSAPSPVPNALGPLTSVPVAISVGVVTVEAAFSDAQTGRIDAVALDRARGSRVFNASPWSTWADIEDIFDTWAENISFAVKVSKALAQ